MDLESIKAKLNNIDLWGIAMHINHIGIGTKKETYVCLKHEHFYIFQIINFRLVEETVTFHISQISFSREFSELFLPNNAFFLLKQLFLRIHTFSTFKESL